MNNSCEGSIVIVIDAFAIIRTNNNIYIACFQIYFLTDMHQKPKKYLCSKWKFGVSVKQELAVLVAATSIF